MTRAQLEIEARAREQAAKQLELLSQNERKRIAADLHDDLGAKLLSIVHTSRSPRIANLGREALDEMRLSVKGLTGKPLPVNQALAGWRSEALWRLEQSGMTCSWPPPEQEWPHTVGARTLVQTTRLMREAISNIIKHSQASHVQVASSVREGPWLELQVQDNGRGFEVHAEPQAEGGSGLLNMVHRAQQLGGHCRMESRPGAGCRITYTLPLS